MKTALRRPDGRHQPFNEPLAIEVIVMFTALQDEIHEFAGGPRDQVAAN